MIRYDFRAGYRDIKSGNNYDSCFKAAQMNDTIIIKDGNVDQTLNLMKSVAHKYKHESTEIAKVLKGARVIDTCFNIWHFLHDHIQYKLDKPGQEQLRTPYRSWAERKTGIDCDCFSVFISTILLNLKINHFFRVTKYDGKPEFQHVYVIATDKNKQYVIDCVLHQFNLEKPYSEKKDYVMSLNGIDIAVLNGADEESLFEKVLNPELSGLGKTEDMLKQHLIDTREYVIKNPRSIQQVDDPKAFIKMLDYALEHWDNPIKREKALAILVANENELNKRYGLEGIEGEEDNLDDNSEFDDYVIGELEGKAERKKKRQEKKEARKEKKQERKEARQEKKEARKEKKQERKEARKSGAKKGFFKKVGQALKKGGNAFIRFNPVSIAARNGFLLFLKLNIKKVAANLKWAYATLEQAKAKGISEDKWNKAKKALVKVEDLFAKKLQGKKDKLKNAMLKGKAGGLSGFDDEEETLIGDCLGEPATAAALAAAAPVIIAVIKIVADSGLLSKKEMEGAELELSQMAETAEGAEAASEINDEMSEDEDYDSEDGGGGIVKKASSFVKKNPLVVGLIGAGIIAGGYFLSRSKNKSKSDLKGTPDIKKKATKSINKAKVMTFK